MNIQVWIIVFFLVRLYGITQPPLESGHNWRQTLTSMIARNFHEHDYGILYPEVDHSGERSGILGSEFAFFSYLIALCLDLFGDAHWYGRLINLVVSSVGVWYFYRLLKELANERVAFFSSMIFLTSIWFAFSRKIMPDTFSCALVIMGVFYGMQYLSSKKITRLLLFFTFCTLGVLSKLPAVCLLGWLVPFVFINNADRKSLLVLGAASVLSMSVVSVWYFYWVPYLVKTYDTQLFFPYTFLEGLYALVDHWQLTAEKFYYNGLQSFFALALLIGGLILAIVKRERNVLLAFAATAAFFSFFIIKTGITFPLHNYYIIPFAPSLALLAGYGVSAIKKEWLAYLLLAASMTEAILNQQHDFRQKADQEYILQLEAFCDEFSAKTDLVVLNGGLSPQFMYFAHRKGWPAYNEDVSNPRYIAEVKAKGCKWLIIDKHKFPAYSDAISLPVLKESEDFIAFAL